MIEGIYDSSRVGPGAADRLRKIREGGLDVVLNYATGAMSTEENLVYADLAQSMGLRVIWNPWTAPATWSGTWIDAVKDHPATWGFYVGDEAQPGSAESAAVWACSTRCKKTGKPTLYVSRPGRAALSPFLGVGSHVGPDCYPIGSPPWWTKPEPQKIGDVAQWSRQMVDAPGGAKKLAFVCQCFAWGALVGEAHPGDAVVWPTEDQMRMMRQAVIRRGHPELLMWFAYHAITDTHPAPGWYWQQFVNAIH